MSFWWWRDGLGSGSGGDPVGFGTGSVARSGLWCLALVRRNFELLVGAAVVFSGGHGGRLCAGHGGCLVYEEGAGKRSYESNLAYVLTTFAIWFMSFTWLFAPFLFNPSEFDWGKIVDDWKDWNKWINQQGGIGIQQDKSWQSWWNDEQAHLRHAGLFYTPFSQIFPIPVRTGVSP
ncbi:hypothetical protein MTR67_009748 [Solanum verrucosum]|uniref:Glycosyl transferase 48 domain-containing protein n=1 Tax=Solanum verrucosum TaxID=315347 RepID=A0AAF0Q4L0_SOLVR|nr:hypothetical protein MTR67_009748 [Solanum verrucosum]